MAYADILLGGAGIAASLFGGAKAAKAARRTRRAQRARYAEAMKIYDRLGEIYKPGGTYGRSLRAGLERRKGLETGAETQRLLASGLAGTTYGGQVGSRWEANVGQQARLSLEDFLTEKYAGTQRAKAGAMLGVQDVGPSYADIMASYSGIGPGLGSLVGGIEELWGKRKRTTARTPMPRRMARPSYGYSPGMY